jgi:RluA family pseudouridine synthase
MPSLFCRGFMSLKKIPKKYQPRGFEILHEDQDIIVGNKAPGFLTVAAAWNRDQTVHSALNDYIRKGQAKSRKEVFVVHRLDQHTSGVMIFAKTEKAQQWLKENWRSFNKTYLTIVTGQLTKKSGLIESYLSEDEDYVVHSSTTDDSGKLARTEYEVLKETERFSLLRINLLTGRKNQIRVHLAGEGHPVVGDVKYAGKSGQVRELLLHAASFEFTHPFSGQRLLFAAKPPAYFSKYVGFTY